MMPQHDTFYDLYSKARKIEIKWPNHARMAIALAGNLEAWTEIPNAKHRRTHHVGGSNPIKEVRCEGIVQHQRALHPEIS